MTTPGITNRMVKTLADLNERVEKMEQEGFREDPAIVELDRAIKVNTIGFSAQEIAELISIINKWYHDRQVNKRYRLIEQRNNAEAQLRKRFEDFKLGA